MNLRDESVRAHHYIVFLCGQDPLLIFFSCSYIIPIYTVFCYFISIWGSIFTIGDFMAIFCGVFGG
jgi:hypothetical protein